MRDALEYLANLTSRLWVTAAERALARVVEMVAREGLGKAQPPSQAAQFAAFDFPLV